MIDFIKKGFFLGLGALALTKEKAEQFVDELMQKGGGSNDKKEELINTLMQKSKEIEEEVDRRVKEQVIKIMEKLGVPTENEIKQLKRKIKDLEQKLSKDTE